MTHVFNAPVACLFQLLQTKCLKNTASSQDALLYRPHKMLKLMAQNSGCYCQLELTKMSFFGSVQL